MSRDLEFPNQFHTLTGSLPFPWQVALYHKFLEMDLPLALTVPAGLGKTSTIAVWLLALAAHSRDGKLHRFPRRLVYVVNRRTVVDQSTSVVERMRKALSGPALSDVREDLERLCTEPGAFPLAISTLRGQFADNGEWRRDPGRPAVIVGTVDMIGSRLLFSGYGCGFRSRPLHAAFLGHDTLIIHDEAHLEPAFQHLLDSLPQYQHPEGERDRFHVLAMSATSRNDHRTLGLSTDDLKNETVIRRVHAAKGMQLDDVKDPKKVVDAITARALTYRDSGKAILIYARDVESVRTIAARVEKAGLPVELLTGTMRGFEREQLIRKEVFSRFLPGGAETNSNTVFLVATSAGEVGVDISADHLVCDLTPLDSMAQRFGRVNRFGYGDAHIDVIYAGADFPADEYASREELALEPDAKANVNLYKAARRATLEVLQKLPLRKDGRHDSSPAALATISAEDRQRAFSPEPEKVQVSEILLDAWSLTSIRGKLPGRPPVENWLHGLQAWEPPETTVAWREEVGRLADANLPANQLSDLLEDYPLKPHELLQDQTQRVFAHIKKIAHRNADVPIWVVDMEGGVHVTTPGSLAREDKGAPALEGSVVLLPPSAGALNKGMLDGDAALDEGKPYDVADYWYDENGKPRRRRTWEPASDGMRLIRTVELLDPSSEDEESAKRWYWYVRPRSADDDGSRHSTGQEMELEAHNALAEHFAARISVRLGLGRAEMTAVHLAARWHDHGKRRAVWQRSIGNYDETRLLAKSGRTGALKLAHYRHEFGSLLDAIDSLEVDGEIRDLALHLIAAHHGRARPGFPHAEIVDPHHSEPIRRDAAAAVPERFAALQRKYGRWRLAYLESLVRAADALASELHGEMPAPPQIGAAMEVKI